MEKRMKKYMLATLGGTLLIYTVLAICIFVFICSDTVKSELTSAALMAVAAVIMMVISAAVIEKMSHRVMKPVRRLAQKFASSAEGDLDSYAGFYEELEPVAETADKLFGLRRDFSANVSHELKTPLTTIRGFGEMMENGIISDPGDVKRYGGTICRESTRLLTLINDIMRLSELENDASTARTEQVDILATAHECEEILSAKAEELDINVTVTGSEVTVAGNASYITELILNLMDNSIKYNRPGGHVTTTVSPMDNGCRIVVEDNGIGISNADRERIFERFYRVDKSRSKETGGTGLGLSIVKHIVVLYGGSLDMDSELDRGTKITVFIPAQ